MCGGQRSVLGVVIFFILSCFFGFKMISFIFDIIIYLNYFSLPFPPSNTPPHMPLLALFQIPGLFPLIVFTCMYVYVYTCIFLNKRAQSV